MSANIEVLMGEVSSNPQEEEQKDVELLLQSFLRSLAEEQKVSKENRPSDTEVL